ncbi:kinase-like domain-containing protein [Lophiotrema nucula]|uniref:Kinase-like domain-containing protein n=1 Tax=Lophiotrema nucula TaxID=690887 RepID=A0A6A5YZY0_9PLEO|nr:kinase-like domain-containing protein [Lophiotrema nucula]
MASLSHSGSEGEFVDSFSKANLNQHPRRTAVNPTNRDIARGHKGSTGLKRDLRDDSPPPYRRDRSPSPYRRPRDRSPSPYRRHRDRSPSPYRPGKDNRASGQGRGQGHKRKGSPPHNNRPEKRYYSDEHRRQERSDRTERQKPSYAGNERPTAVPDFRSVSLSSKHQDSDRRNPASASNSKSNGTQGDADELTTQVEDKAPPEETREEKKRRWAAKKAQYAAQAAAREANSQPLLQQAILGNISESVTPDVGSPSAVSEPPLSPAVGSPAFDSAPASPDVMNVQKEENDSAGASPLADEVSAATYSSADQMDDDRVRAFQQAHRTEIAQSATLPKKKEKKDFDMFADDEDEEDEEVQDGQVQGDEGVVLDKKLLGNWTDKDDYYKLIPNELVGPAHRYKILKFLGKGMFANVARATDTTSDSKGYVAIKITRKNDMMKKSAQREMKFLRELNDTDPQDKRHIIRVFDSFDHKGHFCILFEHMDRNLRDLLKDVTKGHGLTFSAVKTYARQIFSGLYHLEANHIIHFDLKPDNILVSEDLKTIKLCDLGTAEDTRDNYDLSEYVVSRFYRAPEIVLGMPFTHAIDMWAIGCTLYELWTGKILFTGSSNNQMVRAFMECLGWPSEKLLKKGERSGLHFEQGPPLKFLSLEMDPFNNNKLTVRPLEKHRMALRDLKTRVGAGAHGLIADAPKPAELNDLADLLAACLNWNYEKRIKPREAINHKFFNNGLVPRTIVNKPVLPKRGFGARK